jgi:hypothetical protein
MRNRAATRCFERPWCTVFAVATLVACSNDPQVSTGAETGTGDPSVTGTSTDALDETTDSTGSVATGTTATASTGLQDTTSSESGSSETTTGRPVEPVPVRVLAINVGNASPQYGCWEYKLCRSQDVVALRGYIETWQPDIIMLSEVLRAAQLDGLSDNGPILPEGYAGRCGESLDRDSLESAAWNAADASHEHECIAWKTARVTPVEDSAASAYGRNDDWGRGNCSFDFTGFRMRLMVDDSLEVTAVAVHPNSQQADCRTEEIGRYWDELAEGERLVIGGDWNTEDLAEIQPAATVDTAYYAGEHFDIAVHENEYSAHYAFGVSNRKLDHVFVRKLAACTECGMYFGTDDLEFASALGGYDDHPRADGGSGFDHRQILTDLWLLP